MAVHIDKFWIEGVLIDSYPEFHKNEGADLDKDGSITGSEIFGDLDGDKIVGDSDDYKMYLQKNRLQLSQNISFFKWGERLSVGNRIHWSMYLESDLYSDAEVEYAYSFIADLVENVDKKIGEEKLTRKRESQVYYEEMENVGVIFDGRDIASFIADIKDGRLDCDTSGFCAIAIGDERGLELQPVDAPGHVFFRGKDNKGKEFNVDAGGFNTNEFYTKHYNIEPDLVSRGIYLKTRDDQKLRSLFLGNRGYSLIAQGRYEEALKALDKAIEIDPNFSIAHSHRGIALRRLGRYEEALTADDKAIEIDSNIANNHCNRGVDLEKLRRKEEAIEAYKQAIKIDPDHAKAHKNLGSYLGRSGKYEEALKVFERMVKRNLDSADVYHGLGSCLVMLGKNEKALTAYMMALKLDPNNVDVLYFTAELLETLGRDEESLEFLDRLIKEDPSDVSWRAIRNNLLKKLGRSDEVEKIK